jgi:hypothetical protein
MRPFFMCHAQNDEHSNSAPAGVFGIQGSQKLGQSPPPAKSFPHIETAGIEHAFVRHRGRVLKHARDPSGFNPIHTRLPPPPAPCGQTIAFKASAPNNPTTQRVMHPPHRQTHHLQEPSEERLKDPSHTARRTWLPPPPSPCGHTLADGVSAPNISTSQRDQHPPTHKTHHLQTDPCK